MIRICIEASHCRFQSYQSVVVNSTRAINAVQPSAPQIFLAVAVSWAPSVLVVPVMLVRMVSPLPIVMRTPRQIGSVARMSPRLIHLIFSWCDGFLKRDVVKLCSHAK